MNFSEASTRSTASVTAVVDAVEIEVVDDLRALVAEIAVVLEGQRSTHRGKPSAAQK